MGGINICGVDPGRYKLRCVVCGRRAGACVQCAATRSCAVAVHPACARAAGWPMARRLPDSEEPRANGGGVGGRAGPGDAAAVAAAGTAATPGGSLAGGQGQGQGQGQGRRPGAGPDSSSGSHDWVVGGARESPAGLQQPAAPAGAGAAQPSRRCSTPGDAGALLAQGLSAAEAAARRGPEAAAAAAQRVVMGTLLADGSELLCHCPKHAGLPFAPGAETQAMFASIQVERRELLARAAEGSPGRGGGGGRRRRRGGGAAGRGPARQRQQAAAAAPLQEAGADSDAPATGPASEGGLDPRTPPPLAAAAPPPTAAPLQPLRPPPGSSLLQRYQHMCATEGQRLREARSGIHGLGLFTVLPHAPGELVTEYRGEVISRAEADRRERSLYNKLVGAGARPGWLGSWGGRWVRSWDRRARWAGAVWAGVLGWVWLGCSAGVG
jgi:hypothetical protein